MESVQDRAPLEAEPFRRLREMLGVVLASNEFYRRKLAGVKPEKITAPEELRSLPFTTKSELVQDQQRHAPFGSNLTFPAERYIRIHQTSGTTGKPLYWLDTEESWEWWAECWKAIYQAAGVHAADRVYFAFSFGPFIGFWTGWEGARKVGALAISGAGQSTEQRLKAILDYGATVLVCTPTYALHMAAEAKKRGIDIGRGSAVRVTIHAGEPGASLPSTKRLIEESWGAKCYDHAGATEVGAFAFQCQWQPTSLHINEREFVAEVIDPATGGPVGDGERGELLMTNLGRIGSPVIRYRTGDLVRPSRKPCACGSPYLQLEGGILGRVDDMVIVRGVNVFPSAVENVLREFPEIEEFRVEILQQAALKEMKIIIEPAASFASSVDLGERVARRVRERIGLRPLIELAAPQTLPRFELKARRFFKV